MRFILVVALLFGYTAFKAIQLGPSRPALAIALAGAIFAVMLTGLFLPRGNPSLYGRPWFHVFSWIVSLTMALWATFVLVSIPADALQAFVLGAARFVGTELDPERRRFWLRGLHVGVLALSGGMVGAGFVAALLGPVTRRLGVPIEKLPADLRGLKIAQISDLHVGPTIRRGYVEEVARRVNAEKPDMVVLTGDLADARADAIREPLAPLASIEAKHGKFYVTGNHEYYWDADGLVAAMRGLGFTPLLNENRVVDVGSAKVLVAGVTDPVGAQRGDHAPDVARAARTDAKVDLKILLAHRPEAYVEAEPLGFDLEFAGHTHAGQFFPFSLLVGLVHRYRRGLHRHGRMWLHVNPGTGYWGPADRLGIRSEISVLTLDK